MYRGTVKKKEKTFHGRERSVGVEKIRNSIFRLSTFDPIESRLFRFPPRSSHGQEETQARSASSSVVEHVKVEGEESGRTGYRQEPMRGGRERGGWSGSRADRKYFSGKFGAADRFSRGERSIYPVAWGDVGMEGESIHCFEGDGARARPRAHVFLRIIGRPTGTSFGGSMRHCVACDYLRFVFASFSSPLAVSLSFRPLSPSLTLKCARNLVSARRVSRVTQFRSARRYVSM